MQKLKTEMDAQFSRHLEEHPFWKQLARESPSGFQAVRATLLAPGKRLRPSLFCAACRDAGREPVPGLLPIALALELAHSFILIHDDIIDRSADRRGAPTLLTRMNERFEQKPADGFRGADFALVTGDLLYTLAIESLLHADAADSQKVEAIRLFMRAALDTGHGALLEMLAAQTPFDKLTVEDIEKIYALKTGGYTFELPLQLAACFCEDGAGLREKALLFGKAAGIAFQLQNDQNDLRDDLRDGRRTWASVYAGSPEALTDPGIITTVQAAQQEHARRALDLVSDLPGVHALITRALSLDDQELRG